MPAYTLTHGQVNDGVAVVATLTNTPVEVGTTVTISGNATFNGEHLVIACPQFFFLGLDQQGDLTFDTSQLIANQLAFALNVPDVGRAPAAGVVNYSPVCTWVTIAETETWLGFTLTDPSPDHALLTLAVGAANQFAWRRRQASGYTDSLTTVPSQDVKLGTVTYAGYLYRARGSIDQYASFDPLATGTPVGGSFGDILKLLGCNRPQVA